MFGALKRSHPDGFQPSVSDQFPLFFNSLMFSIRSIFLENIVEKWIDLGKKLLKLKRKFFFPIFQEFFRLHYHFITNSQLFKKFFENLKKFFNPSDLLKNSFLSKIDFSLFFQLYYQLITNQNFFQIFENNKKILKKLKKHNFLIFNTFYLFFLFPSLSIIIFTFPLSPHSIITYATFRKHFENLKNWKNL